MPVNMKKVKEGSESKRKRVLKFLKEHEGKGFTRDEIEDRAGVPISGTIPHHFPRFERIERARHQGEVLHHYKFDWAGVLFFIGITVAVIGFSLAAFY